MRRSFLTSTKRAYSASSRVSAEALDAPKYLTVNFCTPHESIFVKKLVERVTVPGEGGDVGLTFAHNPMICQLKPGFLTFSHVDGTVEKFFVSGGFAVGHKDIEVTDVSVPEAFKVEDFDPALVKVNYEIAKKAHTAAQPGTVESSKALIQLTALSTLARALDLDVEKV